MAVLIDLVLKRFIRIGRLDVRYPSGRTGSYGAGEPRVGMEIADRRIETGLLLNPALTLGEAYLDGTVRVTHGTLYDLIDLFLANAVRGGNPGATLSAKLREVKRFWSQYNPAPRARRNVAHHYDLNGRLYDLFLDRDRQYSCAYFPRGDETLDEAQEAKKHHIAAKLLLDRPDLTVLDIGCGWGGLALTLARDYGARVTGITLSTEQLAGARARAAAAGLSDRVGFELLDYRAIDRCYDRIVSVGMFEHVGVGHFAAYFGKIRDCLAEDGVALVHSIGRAAGPGATNPWLDKYIFPGGYSPALSETFAAIERSGLWVTDCEVLRLHYARTIALWRQRFEANRAVIAGLYDERFCRMFELYLVGSEVAFRRQRHMNFQIQLGRQPDAVPLSRDYMVDAERAARHPVRPDVVIRSGDAATLEPIEAD